MNLWQNIFLLASGLIMLWFSFSVLIASQVLYGPDASLIWASGLIGLMGMTALGNIISIIIEELK